MGENRLAEPDLAFIAKLKKAGGANLKKCYQCATCSVVCNVSPEDRPFPRKEMILAQWGQVDKLAKDPDVWLCYQCGDCTARCPRGARPGDVLAAIRSCIYEHYAFPSFLGKALASPKALPLLLLFPMLLIGGMMGAFTGGKFDIAQELKFDNLVSHVWLEVLFIGGNILIFAFAAVSLWRFWQGLQSGPSPARVPLIPAAIQALKGILSHGNFSKCEANKPRYYAHMLVFFGFLGAMATAGLAAVAMKFPEAIPGGFFNTPVPIPLSHPIKWLGNLSGLMGFVGLTILIFRRLKGKDLVGANGYSDWLFLVMLYLCFITGLLTQFIRIAGIATMAYLTYYVHLVIVFFILWYAPYSKFAHMFYRSLALVHLKTIGREARS